MSFNIETISRNTEGILCPPFEWCSVEGGAIILEDASDHGGTKGGLYQISNFLIAKFPITNAQYTRFLDDPNGYSNNNWWSFSLEATQWRNDHRKSKPTAFVGADIPRTRVNWFDCMAFCAWLSYQLQSLGSIQNSHQLVVEDIGTWNVRLPTEQEWQRAAVGDTGWVYPWGNYLDDTLCNYRSHIGSPTGVRDFPDSKSPYGVMNMVGNTWEWCLTAWGKDSIDVAGYTYRIMRGGAWNVSNPEYLRATDRYGHPPRGRLNDAGFRCIYDGR